MRGDSLRDLYAKALALLGLGLLGVAGALVDYWPVRSALPAVASALVLPARVSIPALNATSVTDVSMVTTLHPSAARPHASPMVGTDLTIPDAGATTDALLGVVEGQPESLEPVVVLPPSLEVAAAAMTAMPATRLDLIPPVITAFEATPENPLSSPSAQTRESRLTRSLKTGARAVAWTGTTIARPFVALGHVL